MSGGCSGSRTKARAWWGGSHFCARQGSPPRPTPTRSIRPWGGGRSRYGVAMSDRARWGSYQQIADALRGRLVDVPGGGRVPSEAALGCEFGVSRTTVRRALAVLESEGVIRVDPGRGRVVGSGPVRTAALHVEIASRLRFRIREGACPPGSTLPSESALASAEGVSRSTARAAYRVLEGEGLVVAQQGRKRVVVSGDPVKGRWT